MSCHPAQMFFRMQAAALQTDWEEAVPWPATAAATATAGEAATPTGQESGAPGDARRDVWLDAPCLELLLEGQLSDATAALLSWADKQRIRLHISLRESIDCNCNSQLQLLQLEVRNSNF